MEPAISASTMKSQYAQSQLWPLSGFLVYNAFLLGVLLLTDFNALDLLIVVFFELCAIGVIAWLRLAVAVFFGSPFDTHLTQVRRGSTILMGSMLGAFFAVKFATLMLGLGFALFKLPDLELGFSWSRSDSWHPLVGLCLWLLAARYGLMFVWSTLIQGDYKDASPTRLLVSPYLKGIWVFITIGVGVYLAYRYPSMPELWFTIGIYGAKLLLDLFSLLFELRRTRLGPELEARKQRREARSRSVAIWFLRITLAIAVVGIVGFVAFGILQVSDQVQLENQLEARGTIVQGKVLEKDKSQGSGSMSSTYTLVVGYTQNELEHSNTYSIGRSRWETLAVGDAIEVTLLPDKPHLSQLTELVGTPINGRGFIRIED